MIVRMEKAFFDVRWFRGVNESNKAVVLDVQLEFTLDILSSNNPKCPSIRRPKYLMTASG